jgi:hypothetical protein
MCGTKTESTQDTKQHTSFNYDPTAMKAYTKGVDMINKLYMDQVQRPFDNPAFQMDVTTGVGAASKLGQRGINNITQNARAGGYGDMNMPGFQASMLNRAGRDTGSMQAQAMRQAINNAIQNKAYSASELFHFQPLMTGTDSTGHSTNTTQTSGLGTWLPQVAGAAIGGVTGALTGGMMKGGGGGGGGGASSGGGFAGSLGASPGGNFNPSYFGFSGYQSPMQQMNMPFSGPNPFTG